jgi:Predicted glycosyl hydrolase
MNIYVVKPEDTLNSIAMSNNTTVNQLINDNGLQKPYTLVTGEALVITYPNQIHTVKEGDTLDDIAKSYNISVMQLLRNNSFLSDRQYIYLGETLVIDYALNEKIITNGYSYSFIEHNTLIKTLPYLTYLSIFNYTISSQGELIRLGDETDIVQSSKLYGTLPLLMVSALSPEGKLNIETVYDILLNEENQDKLIVSIIDILNSNEYYGLNILISYININNQDFYIKYLSKIANKIKEQGFKLFLTINPNIRNENDTISFEQLDYSAITTIGDEIIFLQYYWGTNNNPPQPVSSIQLLKIFTEYVTRQIPTDKLSMGKPLLGYDWELPYVSGSYAYSLTLNSVVTLASNEGAEIQFDKISQTPFFKYTRTYAGLSKEHIVWFIDARSINSLDKLIVDNNLKGTGLWNVMIFFQQLWTIINSQYEIVKLI